MLASGRQDAGLMWRDIHCGRYTLPYGAIDKVIISYAPILEKPMQGLDMVITSASITKSKSLCIKVKISNHSTSNVSIPGLPSYPYGVELFCKRKNFWNRIELKMNRIKSFDANFPARSMSILPSKSHICLEYYIDKSEFVSVIRPSHVRFSWAVVIDADESTNTIFHIESQLKRIKI